MIEAQSALQRAAALRAVTLVESGMVVGLGTGRTARVAVREIGALIRAGSLRGIVGVATSRVTAAEAERAGIPLLDQSIPQAIDLTIDGADEVDPVFNLIKGGGGALLREKIVAEASRREVIVVDDGKLSPKLGSRWPVPVEVIRFGWRAVERSLTSLGARVTLRLGDDHEPVTTDQDNLILDCQFGPLEDPHAIASALGSRAGVVAHGLFLGLTTDLIVASPTGVVHQHRESGPP